MWKKLHVGEIVKVRSEEFIPCDLLILQTSDEKGTCFVETKGLDGETNLKIKSATKELQEQFKSENELANIGGILTCEKPNNAIYKFEGTCKIPTIPKVLSLNIDNLLLRGSRLMNTEYIYGVTVFQGHDTKIMQNSAQAKYKFSKLELATNNTIMLTLCVQVCLALIGALVGATWTVGVGKSANYMGGQKTDYGFGYYLIQMTGTWILIFTNFVPISLMVTLEMVKFWQAGFMTRDYMMYDEEQDMAMLA